MTIVIAWIAVVEEWDGELYRVDLGRRPNMVTRRSPRAVIWTHRGGVADLIEAEARAASLYPDDTRA